MVLTLLGLELDPVVFTFDWAELGLDLVVLVLIER